MLAFAERLIVNAAGFWKEFTGPQKQRFQAVLFPEGLAFDGEEFGTARTNLFIRELHGITQAKERMVTPPGFEPGSPA